MQAGRRVTGCALLLLATGVARAQAPDPSATVLPQIEIVGSTPLPGPGIDPDTMPEATRRLTGHDIARDGTPDLLRTLDESVPGLTLDSASGNPFQPSLFYHGFQASPLQGTSEGLAVYLNGVRFNQAFGDTVNWDLLPDIAIDRLDLVGSDPAFGLNALGGALSIQLRNGFTYDGGTLDVSGGSFGQAETAGQYGHRDGDVAVYVAGSLRHEGGWRDLQSSDLYNIVGDLGWRGDRAELHLTLLEADTVLNGPGTSPVQLLAADPSAQFTAPNLIDNSNAMASLAGSYDVSDATSLQAVLYTDYFRQSVLNGNATDVAPCGDGSGVLCAEPGSIATGRDGAALPDFLHGGPYSELDRQTTDTGGYGASLQLTDTRRVAGHDNQLSAGASLDGADSLFDASSAIGGLTGPTRSFVGPGLVIDQADGSIVPVRVSVGNAYAGVFLTDTLSLTSRLSATIAGRFNDAVVDLRDRIGTALDGRHQYNRFDPSGGLSYRFRPGIDAYADYAETSRNPTPAELSCASAASPCSLANFFVGDPDLKQVVGHTIELGLRGRQRPWDGATLSWDLDLFRTDLDDDILFVDSPVLGRAFFRNVGTTRRQGIDAGMSLMSGRWTASLDYSVTDATFRTGFTESSQDNPGADSDGTIRVRPGDRLPGIPLQLLKLGLSDRLTDRLTLRLTAIAASGAPLFGDEADLEPRLPAYVVLNLYGAYQLTSRVQLFGQIENLADAHYATYGTFSPTSSVFLAQAPGATDPRSVSPAAPIGGFGGLHVTF